VAAFAAVLAGCGTQEPVAKIRALHAEGRFQESLATLGELVAARPDDPELLYLYGQALVRTAQPSLALWSLRKAMETREWLVPAGLELAAAALQTGNEEAAIEATTRILEAEPDHLDALLLRARAGVSTPRRYEEALADADRALELDPGNVDALVPRAVALLGLERVEEADAALSELERGFRDADLGPDNAARYCSARALFLQAKGDLEAAERGLGECLEEFPASALVVQDAVEFYEEQGKPERAIEILRKALTEAPGGGHRPALAARLRRAGEVEEAERVLLEGTELEPPALALVAWVDLSDHYLALEDYGKAASAMEQAMGLGGKQDAALLFRYADLLVMAARYDEALEVAREMELPAHRELVAARVALEQGRPGEALERFGEGLRLWPNNAVARYYAALAAEAVGDFDRAISEYRYSIRADPEATDARLRLGRLHEAEGSHDLALAAVRHDSGRRAAGGIELDLVALRIAAQLGRRAEVRSLLARVAATPGAKGRAVAAVAEGTRERGGPREAARVVREAEGLDLQDRGDADALRALVLYLGEAGEPEQGVAAAEAALAKHPDAAVFHEIHGRALEASHAPAEAVRAAYARAAELDPDHAAPALAGLARLAEEAGDPQAALDLYSRAAAADREDPSPLRESAELLISLGRREEAERQLGETLARDPYDAGAAARLAELLLDREGDPDRALELARRAVRFRGGAQAYGVLARVYERRGEAQLAAEASANAKVARQPSREERP
jgi:tetratricopeptide (TPR) repeat protein